MFKETDPIPGDEETIAECYWSTRYYDYDNANGALKYDPLDCSKIHNFKTCQELRNLRFSNMVSFKYATHLLPECNRFDRKIMAVLSIGCPKLLTDKDFVKHLLWAAEAKKRPTILVIHHSEARIYLDKPQLRIRKE